MDAEKYYALALEQLVPEALSTPPAFALVPRPHISRITRVAGAAGECLVALRKNVARLEDLVKAYADECEVEDEDMHTELTQGFRLFDGGRAVVRHATRVTFRDKHYDCEGCLRDSGAGAGLEVVDASTFVLVLGSFPVRWEGVFYGEVNAKNASSFPCRLFLPRQSQVVKPFIQIFAFHRLNLPGATPSKRHPELAPSS